MAWPRAEQSGEPAGDFDGRAPGFQPARSPDSGVPLTYVHGVTSANLTEGIKAVKQVPAPRDAAEVPLSLSEGVVLLTMQLVLLHRDLRVDPASRTSEIKSEVRERLESDALAHLAALPGDAPAWCQDLAATVESLSRPQAVAHLESVPVVVGGHVQSRARALLVLIELCAWEPWPDGVSWAARTRRDSLTYLAGYLPALASGDVKAVTREFDAVIDQLRRRSIRWSRVAAVSVLGLGLGALTAGLAAPLIGAAVGGAAGLSGAAASSAGLAALGGGSVAAGGFGVAGGTALVIGIGGLSGVGVAATGARAAGWTSGQLVADTIKLDVITRLVILEAEGDDEKARRVVESLQARLADVTAKIRELAQQMRALAETNVRLTKENEELREQLREQHRQAELTETVLEVVLDRLPTAA